MRVVSFKQENMTCSTNDHQAWGFRCDLYIEFETGKWWWKKRHRLSGAAASSTGVSWFWADSGVEIPFEVSNPLGNIAKLMDPIFAPAVGRESGSL